MDNNIEKHIEEICIKANKASKSLSHASSKSKNQALQLIAKHIKKDKNDILKANSIDCLLYTSPSPRDRTRSRMPSSA